MSGEEAREHAARASAEEAARCFGRVDWTDEERIPLTVAHLVDAVLNLTTPTTPEVTDEPGSGAVVRDRKGRGRHPREVEHRPNGPYWPVGDVGGERCRKCGEDWPCAKSPADDEAVERLAVERLLDDLADEAAVDSSHYVHAFIAHLLNNLDRLRDSAGWREVGAGQVVVDEAAVAALLIDATPHDLYTKARHHLSGRIGNWHVSHLRDALDAGAQS